MRQEGRHFPTVRAQPEEEEMTPLGWGGGDGTATSWAFTSELFSEFLVLEKRMALFVLFFSMSVACSVFRRVPGSYKLVKGCEI